MLDESNAYLPDDPTGGAELIFMQTGHYTKDGNYEVDQIVNQNKLQQIKEEGLKDNDILVTLESHDQVVINPEQLIQQSSKERLQEINEKIFQNQTQVRIEEINRLQQLQEHPKKPLFSFLYDKIAKAHDKAMPEFLKTEQEKIHESNLRNKAEEKLLEEQVLRDFPITVDDLQEAFSVDQALNNNREEPVIFYTLETFEPKIPQPDLIGQNLNTDQPIKQLPIHHVHPILSPFHMPAVISKTTVTTQTPTSISFSESQEIPARDVEEMGDRLSRGVLVANEEDQYQKYLISNSPLLHKPTFTEKFKIAFNEALHHGSPIDNLIEEIKHNEVKQKEREQEEAQDDLETQRFNELEKMCENQDKKTKAENFIKKEVNYVVEGVKNLFSHHKIDEAENKLKENPVDQKEIDLKNEEEEKDMNNLLLFGFN